MNDLEESRTALAGMAGGCGRARLGDGQFEERAGEVDWLSFNPAFLIRRLEEAGATLLALPSSGYSTRLKVSQLEFVKEVREASAHDVGAVRPAVPSAARISLMDEAFGWLALIPQDRFVLRRILGARSLVSPVTARHLFSWRKLGAVMGADHKAVQRWHAQGVNMLVTALVARSRASGLQPIGL